MGRYKKKLKKKKRGGGRGRPNTEKGGYRSPVKIDFELGGKRALEGRRRN